MKIGTKTNHILTFCKHLISSFGKILDSIVLGKGYQNHLHQKLLSDAHPIKYDLNAMIQF